MKIKSCEIKSFGKLSDKTVSPSDGITVIRGKNESGKSTLCAFIKYVLYGFSGKGSRDERNNEKLRYTPWNGLKCAGALILEDAEHNLYRVERKSDGKTSKSKIFNSGGAECYEGFDAGNVFYGIDSSAFAKSSFVGQDDIEPDDMKELGTSLEKLLFKSGNDETDFVKASKTLTNERNKLYNKLRGTGRIFELEEKLITLREKRITESENNKLLNVSEFAASETEKSLELTCERLEKLYLEAQNIEAYKASELLEKIEYAENRFRESEKIYSETAQRCTRNGFIPDRKYLDELTKAHSDCVVAEPEYKAAQKELSELVLKYNATVEKIHEGNSFDGSIDSDSTLTLQVMEEAQELHSKAKKLKKLAILFFCLVVTMPVSVILFMLLSKKKKELSELLSKYGFEDMTHLRSFCKEYNDIYPSLGEMRAEIGRMRKITEEKRIESESSLEYLCEKLLRIGCNVTEEDKGIISQVREELIPALSADVAELERAFGEYSKNKNAYEALISVSDVMQLRMLAEKKSEEPPTRPKEEVDRAIKYDEGAKTLLSKKLADYKTEIARLSAIVTDPADIENEIYELQTELDEAKINTEALDLAIELLEKSGESIRGDVFPQISERAGELFSNFTGGKYRSLFFDKDFAVKVLEENDSETRKAGFLSSGTYDAAYIALRVALMEYLCKNKPTLIFDDSFAKIDDTRLTNILNVLCTLSEEYQIIILSCHDREARILGEKCKVVVMDEE